MIVQAHALSNEGWGIAQDPESGQVVFVKGLLPQERAKVHVIHRKKHYSRAHIIQLLQASPDRVQPVCPHAQQLPYSADPLLTEHTQVSATPLRHCGGCGFMHIKSEKQMAYKTQFFFEHLGRVGKWPQDWQQWVKDHLQQIPLSQESYRRRVRLHFKNRELGFLQEGSHGLCPIDSCCVATPAINAILPELKKQLCLLSGNSDFSIELCLTENLDKSVSLSTDPNVSLSVMGTTEQMIISHPFFESLSLPCKSFVQAHTDCLNVYCHLIETSFSNFLKNHMANTVIPAGDFSQHSPLLCWDLFCGSGVFSYIFSHVAQQHGCVSLTEAVEGDDNAIASLRLAYKKKALKQVRAHHKNVFAFCKAHPTTHPLTAVLLNPPRTGTSPEFLQLLSKRLGSVAWLGYLSCDSATLARDTAVLKQEGFTPSCAALIDAFGHTPHYETFLSFVRGVL